MLRMLMSQSNCITACAKVVVKLHHMEMMLRSSVVRSPDSEKSMLDTTRKSKEKRIHLAIKMQHTALNETQIVLRDSFTADDSLCLVWKICNIKLF